MAAQALMIRQQEIAVSPQIRESPQLIAASGEFKSSSDSGDVSEYKKSSMCCSQNTEKRSSYQLP